MTKLRLSTIDTKLEMTSGHVFEVSTFSIGAGEPFPREVVTCRTLGDVRNAVAEYGAKAAEASPDRSFSVSISALDRKMRGFDDAARSPDYLGRKAWIKPLTAQ